MTLKLPGLVSELSVPVMRFVPPQRKQLLGAIDITRPAVQPRRRRLWDLSSHLHCSIIGTCLTTAELRQILVKMDLPGAEKDTDHELHGCAVLLAAKRDRARLLQKALDRKHRSAISQFDKARNTAEVTACWEGAVQRADIPGAYWAVMTHPETTEDLVRRVYGEVHMLSHLVGAANRADIRRLRDLEAENAELREKIAQQQRHIREVVIRRDAEIARLNERLSSSGATAEQVGGPAEELVSDLSRRLELECTARQKIEQRIETLIAERDEEREQRAQAAQREALLRRELEAAELSLAALAKPDESEVEDAPPPDLSDKTVLYVGGRADQVAQLRAIAEQWGATFLHHDGGIDNNNGFLASQVACADRVFFPVDCVSHNAVDVVKRVSRSAGTAYVPLRSAGLTSFVAALRDLRA